MSKNAKIVKIQNPEKMINLQVPRASHVTMHVIGNGSPG